MGIADPTRSASRSYQASMHVTVILTAAIKEGSTFDLNSLVNTVSMARHQDALSRDACYEQQLDSLLSDFDAFCQHAILCTKDQNISAWLSALPLVKNRLDLSAHEFRDRLALRYKKSLSQMPKSCDGCGGTFSMEHALDCRFGALVGRRHNKVHDAIGDLPCLVWSNIVHEPVVSDQSASSDGACVLGECGFLNLRHYLTFALLIQRPVLL